MKILLANHQLKNKYGTETWTITMAEELEKLGHQIGTYVADGKDRLINKKVSNPDLAIINHNSCLRKLKNLSCKKIFTSHGVVNKLEEPCEGADAYVSISEEVQKNLINLGFNSTIIRNGINCEKFISTKKVNKKLKKVLFSSKHRGKTYDIVVQACKNLGVELEVIGDGNIIPRSIKKNFGLIMKSRKFPKFLKILLLNIKKSKLILQLIRNLIKPLIKLNTTNNVIQKINDADLVIGIGRTAYEAMACERNVIIYDYHGADGFVTPDMLIESRKNNCSGRRYKKKYSVNDLEKELLKYDPEIGILLRKYILENNNSKKVAKEYLDLYNNIKS